MSSHGSSVENVSMISFWGVVAEVIVFVTPMQLA